MLGQVSRISDLVEKTKRHIENYKKQDIFADATQAREGIETSLIILHMQKVRIETKKKVHVPGKNALSEICS